MAEAALTLAEIGKFAACYKDGPSLQTCEAPLTLYLMVELLLQPPAGAPVDPEDDLDDSEAILPISGLDVVRRETGTVQDARGAVTQEMMDMVQTGLEILVSMLLRSRLDDGLATDPAAHATRLYRINHSFRPRYRPLTTSRSFHH